jgi:membrane dipeptidase
MGDAPITIDGLVISRWSRAVFEDMAAGGLTAANCTCSVWENFRDTMEAMAAWRRRFVEHADLIRPVETADDIRAAHREGRVGIILGWQNLSAIEDRIDFLDLFHGLGLRVAQLTYNTRNLVGSGCWESRDGGLSDFGRHVIARMNELGIVIDLSHVGETTSAEAIAASARPVAYTHVAPRALKDHARNKTDAELRAVAEPGGFVGYATYPAFLPSGGAATLDEIVDGFEHMIDVCGEEAVGVGTDFTQDQPLAFFEWLRRDKGDGAFCVPGTPAVPKMPEGLARLSDYPNLIRAMERRGWPAARIERIMGLNWLRFLEEAWAPGAAASAVASPPRADQTERRTTHA